MASAIAIPLPLCFFVSFRYAGSEKTWPKHFISISLALVTLPAVHRWDFYFRFVISDLKNPRVIVSPKKSCTWLPHWIHHFEFWNSDFRFVISNLKNPWITGCKPITAKLSMFHQKIMYFTAILNPPFRILRFWFQIRNQWLQKPLSKSFQTDLSIFSAVLRRKNWKMITWFSSLFFNCQSNFLQ